MCPSSARCSPVQVQAREIHRGRPHVPQQHLDHDGDRASLGVILSITPGAAEQVEGPLGPHHDHHQLPHLTRPSIDPQPDCEWFL